MAVLPFVPFSSSIDPSFWHTLTKLKIDVIKLDEEPIPIVGWYQRGRWIRDRESSTGSEIGLDGEFRVDRNSFSIRNRDETRIPGRIYLRGWLKNFNKVEDFKQCDKQALFNSFSDRLWQGLKASDPLVPTFMVITFADLKKYKYYYWFAFPAFVPKPSWTIPSLEWPTLSVKDSIELGELLAEADVPELIAKKSGGQWSVAPLSLYGQFFENVPEEDRHLIFFDPSTNSQALGWPLRNGLARLRACCDVDARKLKIIAFRDPPRPPQPYAVSHSLVVSIELPEQELSVGERPAAVGWEKNAQGKLGPRLADLAPMMDPRRLAEQAVDLNLKLMRWRILPDLDLEKISSAKCLLLGAGTLGCYVARALMAWGVRKITFVDSAKVSFSNPVRQPLFEFQDCLEAGKPKAACAAAALRRIYPGVHAEGVELSIPMPGHPIPSHLVDQAKQDVQKIERLFDQHDVVYLLMDSRESRWLPTLLGASKRKLVMNAALGFDSYLVMRHGFRPLKPVEDPADTSQTSGLPQIRQLGCYFCNDVVAPSDSLADRTLDQMCTVTRPGLAPLASATAVEIMASVLQHPDGPAVLAEVENSSRSTSKESQHQSVLGLVPHQIRGFLSKFESMKLVGPAYDKCTGCSETVIKSYEVEGFDMLLKVFNELKYLEKLSGLDKLHDESENVLMEKCLDWDDEEE